MDGAGVGLPGPRNGGKFVLETLALKRNPLVSTIVLVLVVNAGPSTWVEERHVR